MGKKEEYLFKTFFLYPRQDKSNPDSERAVAKPIGSNMQ